ncbi:MAG: hypothetical protein RBG13Loki_1272 [Promethearchaeota archaeon CR_4]|nr:MAG: hypothetical protein RBG13Loki_1272 [Candidatus Lokiarchaeota archaeon CR_4]
MHSLLRKRNLIIALVTITAGAVILGLIASGHGQGSPPATLNVLYIGEDGQLLQHLALDKETLNVTYGEAEDITEPTFTSYNAVVINDVNLTADQISNLTVWSAENDGTTYSHAVVIIMGPTLTRGNEILSGLGFTTQTTFQNNTDEVKALSVEGNSTVAIAHPLMKAISFNAFPEIVNYTQFTNMASIDGNIELIEMQNVNGTSTDNSLVLARNAGGDVNKNLNLIIYACWLEDAFLDTDHNGQFITCPYFNYLLFGTVVTGTGSTLVAYGSWTYAPVPHLADQVAIGCLVIACTIVAILLYRRARAKKVKVLGITEEEKIQELGAEPESKRKGDVWEEIGFHRQVSGFIKMFFLIMILIIPQLIITSIIMPRFLNPYPQASGWYDLTFRFFEGIWLLFDMGFNYAFCRFFAKHRIEHPEKAYHYAQLFVWWQMFTGLVQIFAVAFIGSIFLPGTNLGYVSWMFVAHSLVQFPGIYLVYQYFFQGDQKADYQMISFVLREFLLRLASQALLVPIFRAIFAGQVMYGPAFGAGMGLIVGYQLGDILVLLVTWRMYKGLGLKSAPIFAAQFTREEFKETARFGFKMAIGEVWVPFVWLLQVWLVAEYLPNASAEQGYFSLAWTISVISQAVLLLTTSMLGALTEAHTYNKKALLNYTSSSGWKWCFMWTVFLCTSLWAIGRTFIIGASGELWARAADLLPLLVLFNLLGPISWQGDQEFGAANKPGYAGLAWIIEQAIRASLLLLLVPMLKKMEVVIWIYIVALSVKDVFVWITIRRKIHKWDWNLWPTFVAPALAGIFNFLLLWLLAGVLGESILDAMILFIVAMFGMVFLFSFFVGLFGGYDTNTLAELDKATRMVTGLRKLTRFYYYMAAGGARISPLHNKFPVKIYAEATKEAAELTAIKKKIQIIE